MKRQEVTTTDLADFGFSERDKLIKLLCTWHSEGLPEGFDNNEVRAMMNRNSGFVFLINSEYQCAMMNDDKLEIWYYCSNCGNDGFEEDCQINENGCNECNEEEGN